MTLELKDVRVVGICMAVGCEKKTHGKLCPTHRSTKARLADPVRYAFNCKRNRAKQRGIFWDLTLEQFREFCHETDYMDKKGKMAGSHDVDRIVEGKTPGYTITNIQLLDKVTNIKKYKKYDYQTKKAVNVIEIEYPKEDLPF